MNRIPLHRVAERLYFPAGGQAICTGWDSAMQTNPANGLPFLQAEYITQAARDVFLTDDMIRALISFAPRVASD